MYGKQSEKRGAGMQARWDFDNRIQAARAKARRGRKIDHARPRSEKFPVGKEKKRHYGIDRSAGASP